MSDEARHGVSSKLASVARLVDGLCDPARRDRLAAIMLAAFVVIYTIYATLGAIGTDIHRDILEAVGWSSHPALGYHHPPLSAWVAMIWFFVFPYADWSAFLLAASVSGLTLWIAWLLFGEFLDERKRVVGLAMLTLVPLYTFHALKYNANTVIMPCWAAASLFFLRSFLRLDVKQAALAGAAAGLAMLGKYWSVYLIAGLGLAALMHPRRKEYFSSAAPWVSMAVGLLVLAPHLWWIASGRTETLAFAAETAASAHARLRSLTYLAAIAAYVAGPLIIYAALRPSRAAVLDTVVPSNADRRMIACVFWCGLLLPAVVNLFVPTRLSAVWTMPNWALLPVVLLGAPLIQVNRDAAARVVAAAIAVTALSVVAFPIGVVLDQMHGPRGNPGPSHWRQVASAAEKLWHEQTAKPLRLVGGEADLSYAIMFYGPRGITPVVSDLHNNSNAADRIEREGILVVCPAIDKGCLSLADRLQRENGGRREEIEAQHIYLGIRGRTARFVLLAIPPR